LKQEKGDRYAKKAKSPDWAARKTPRRMMPLEQRIYWQIEKSFLPILKLGTSTAALTEKPLSGVDYRSAGLKPLQGHFPS
jgi:hypothetical protein